MFDGSEFLKPPTEHLVRGVPRQATVFLAHVNSVAQKTNLIKSFAISEYSEQFLLCV